MSVRRSLLTMLGCFIGVACSGEDASKNKRIESANGHLREQNAALQAQLDALGPAGSGLVDMQRQLREVQEQLASSQSAEEILQKTKEQLELDIAALANSDSGGAILELRRQLRETNAKLEEEKQKLSELAANTAAFDTTIKTTLEPFLGLYISRDDPLQVEGSRCRMFLYVENAGGITRGLLCADGRLQWEKQRMLSFDAAADELVDGTYVFGVRTESTSSSCNREPSFLASSTDYNFARAGRYGVASFSVAVRTDSGDKPLLLDNAAVTFTSGDCDDIIARELRPGPLNGEQSETLKMSAQFCHYLQGDPGLTEGCFFKPDGFLPLY